MNGTRRFFSNLSITHKVAFALCAFILLTFVADFVIEKIRRKIALGDKARIVSSRMASGLGLGLYNVSEESVASVIDAELMDADIEAVKVVEPGAAKPFSQRGRDAAGKNASVPNVPEFPAATHESPIVHNEKEIGRVTVYLNDRHLNRDLNVLLMTKALQFSVIVGGVLLCLFSIMNRSLIHPIKDVIHSLTGGGKQVATSAQFLSRSSELVSDNARTQAATVEETSASLEEITSSTRLTSDNAEVVKTEADQARKVAETGSSSIEEMSHLLNNMATFSADMHRTMDGIREASQSVSKVIKSINEIAFQTNILALNASVEAARAGSAGQGFAVVADAVRALAQRSANAANETARLIEESIQRNNEGVTASERVREALEALETKAADVKSQFEQILGRVRKVDSLVGEISTACAEQKVGLEQISGAVFQLQTVAQSSSESAQQTELSSKQLETEAGRLRHQIDVLENLIGAN